MRDLRERIMNLERRVRALELRLHNPTPQPPARIPVARVYTQNPRPTGEFRDELLDLVEYHRETWKLECPDAMPIYDDAVRVKQAVQNPRFGAQACRAAILGHSVAARKEGSKLGRNFRHVFPAAFVGGQRATNKLDLGRFEEFVQTGRTAQGQAAKARAVKARQEEKKPAAKEPKDEGPSFEAWLQKRGGP